MRSLARVFALIASLLFVCPAFANADPVAAINPGMANAVLPVPAGTASSFREQGNPDTWTHALSARLNAVLKETGATGKYPWLGALLGIMTTILGAAACWYAPQGVVRLSKLLAESGWSILWAAPMLFYLLYAIFHEMPQLPTLMAQWLALTFSLFGFGTIIQMAEDYPVPWRVVRTLACLGHPGPSMTALYVTAYLGVLAVAIPGSVTGFAVLASASIALAVCLYYGVKPWVQKSGMRLGAAIAGHLLVAALASAAQGVLLYPGNYLSLAFQIYCALVVAVCWSFLWSDVVDYDPERHQYVALLKAVPPGLISAAPLGMGGLAWLLGFGYAAGIFATTGVILVRDWLNRAR